MSEDGSDDSAPRPKRKIKRFVVLDSSASSDSDESIGPTGTRRKRMRVVSDAESESSGSSVGARRKRTLPKLRDSDGDSDTSGWATDHSDAPKPAPASAKPNSGFASDSSEGNSDKCSICLMRFTTQLVGTPQNCEHIFCLDCITEWSKNVNTCPVDRITFDSIVVRACAGGRVLRTEPVKVVERRPSVEMLVVEDPTVCEICGSAENEETMLLCDGCDLGFHMQCLTPPLTEIPADQWLCPNCDNILDVIHLSEVEDLFTGLEDIDLPLHPRPTPLREPRNVRRSSRNQSSLDEPSTSSGRRVNSSNVDATPSSSRGSSISHRTSSRGAATTRRATGTQRRKYKRRRTKTVIIEYEVEENGKFPITKRVKRRVKKRRTKKRQPRTVARRSHVRASVRARLAHMAAADAPVQGSAAGLTLRRHRAGIPALSLFGSRHQLEYFSEEDERDVSEGATAAVAVRPTSSILSAYRQARRKMITIPSPPHASSAPDLLSSILDSQSKLHSKNSIVSISVDGNVNIKLQTRNEDKSLSKTLEPKKDDNKKVDLTQGTKKVDLTKGEDAAKKVPSYPGQSRGGGWGGGYRGNYHREQGSSGFNRGGGGYAPDNNNYGGGGYGDGAAGTGGGNGGFGYQNRQQGGAFNNNMRRDDSDYGNYQRRQYPYPQNEENNFDRNRRPQDSNRPQNLPHNQRPNEQGRHSLGPSWQPYGGAAPAGPRRDGPQMRHSFGGSENPLDMRMGQVPPQNAHNSHPSDSYAPEPQKPQPYRPLPEPPVFKFDKTPEVEKSEDEKSDSGLVIDTEKYDPTEPTNDDDDDEEAANVAEVASSGTPQVEMASSVVASVPAAGVVQNIIAGIDATSLNVPANVLDSAVRQVLQEHRDLITPAVAPSRPRAESEDDSDGDCPNFSIYSATSVHIANDSNAVPETPAAHASDDMADLVQEDDETPPRAAEVDVVDKTPTVVTPSKQYNFDTSVKKKTEEELKEKVSKRCPITTNPRNPIKIKLNTPSLIKRHIPLYDEEELADDAEPESEPEPEHEREPEPEPQGKADHSDESQKKILNKDGTKSPSDRAEVPEEKEDTVSKAQSDNEQEITKDDEKTTDDIEAADEASPNKESEGPEEKAASNNEDYQEDDGDNEKSPKTPEELPNEEEEEEDFAEDEKEEDKDDDSSISDKDEKLDDLASDEDVSEGELPAACRDSEAKEGGIEKMTESISETEDERSYTPCLDENKSKDTSLETEKDKGIEGLDTEMISEDEGNEMFSEEERQAERSPPRADPPPPPEEGEILDKRKEKTDREEPKKRKRKDSKRESKKESKEKKKKKSEVAFKKLSKSGKERNYRDKDKEDRPRRDSSEGERKRKRKEKRKDLERYDVRTVVSEKRRRAKDPFGRDVSPRRSRSPSLERSPPERSPSGPRRSQSRHSRHSRHSRRRRSSSRPPERVRHSPSSRRSPSPLRVRRSSSRGRLTPRRVGASPSPRPRPSPSPRSPSPAKRRRRTSGERPRRRRSGERVRKRRRSGSRSASPRDKSKGKRRRRARSERPAERATERAAERVTERAAERAAERRAEPRRRSPKRRRARRRSAGKSPVQPPPAAAGAWSPLSMDSRLLSPRTPPPAASPPPPPRRPRARPRHAPAPSKEVFTSGDNILVSVSFKEQERAHSPQRRGRRARRKLRRRRASAAAATDAARPVAIIDLERSPFRELTPSPRNVIVLSDSSQTSPAQPAHAQPPPDKPPPADAVHHGPPATTNGPRTPPSRSPAAAAPAPAPAAAPAAAAAPAPAAAEGDARGPNTPPEPPSSPDAYDPFEPTRSASASPSAPPAAASPPADPPRPSITLETAQKTNLSADDVIDRRPLSPMEKVMALLASTRDVSPEPPPTDAPQPPPAASPPAAAPLAPAPAPRIVLPDAQRHHPQKGAGAPKLFLAKPSPIKSDPIKPMQLRPAAAVAAAADSPYSPCSPYSPGESDFGELFEPPAAPLKHKPRDIFDALVDKRRHKSSAAKVPVKLNKKRGKTQVGVKIDEDNLKILDDLPSSAVEMQVKSKSFRRQFLKKLNRQERVVEEVKLVLKPHYNKKRVTKDEYKDILRRAVPKICHNKTGEINPTKIQALVEAYVKKFRKKHKLGLV